MKKRFGLLTGNVVLLDAGGGEYDCTNVLRCSKAAFDSAGSQGNYTMREKLLEAQRAKKWGRRPSSPRCSRSASRP